MDGRSGMTRAELWQALRALEHAPDVPAETRNLLRELQRHQLELELQNRELQERIAGRQAEVHLVSAPFEDGGPPPRQRQVRLGLAEREAITGTLAGIASEINNALGSLMCNLSVARRKLRAPAPPDPTEATVALEAVTEAEDGADRIRGAVKDLSTFVLSIASREHGVDEE